MKVKNSSDLSYMEGQIISLKALLKPSSKICDSEKRAIRKRILVIRLGMRAQKHAIRTEKKAREAEYMERRARILAQRKKDHPEEFRTKSTEASLEEKARKILGLPSREEMLAAKQAKKDKVTLKKPDFSKLDKRQLALKRVEFLYVTALDPDISEEYKALCRVALKIDQITEHGDLKTEQMSLRLATLVPAKIKSTGEIVYLDPFDVSMDGTEYTMVFVPTYIDRTKNLVSGNFRRFFSSGIELI